jgi:hypothetical protein
MKLSAFVLLILTVIASSTAAMAEGPVPFNALMQAADAQSSVPPISDTRDQSAAASTQPAHKRDMTTGGKILTSTGVVTLLIGVAVITGTAVTGAAFRGWESHPDSAKLYGAGTGLVAGGATLVILGVHRRSAK